MIKTFCAFRAWCEERGVDSSQIEFTLRMKTPQVENDFVRALDAEFGPSGLMLTRTTTQMLLDRATIAGIPVRLEKFHG